MMLGNSDMDASRIALSMKNFDKLSYVEAAKLVDTALENGITMFDHAAIYGDGRCEELFGQVISENKGMRQRMRIQTKCGCYRGYYDLSYAHILSSVEDSLRRLQVDCIDVLLLGKPDYLMDTDEVAEAIYQLQKSGKVRQFGLSHFDGEQMDLLQSSCKETFLINRISCGVASGSKIEDALKLVDKCGLYGVTVQATDTILRENVSSETKASLERLSDEYKVSENAIALAWSLRHPARLQVTTDVIDTDELISICKASKINLTRKEWYEIFFTISHKHDKVL